MHTLLIHTAAQNSARLVDEMTRRTTMTIEVVTTAAAGLAAANQTRFDLIVASLDAPDDSSLNLIEALRANGGTTPIIMLTAECAPQIRVDGLRRGADDWTTLPCDIRIIVARIVALSRRARSRQGDIIEIGNFRIDVRNQTVCVGSQLVPLTCREYDIVEFLAQRQGFSISKDGLLSHLYNGRDEPELKIIDVFICKVRKKLAEFNNGEHCIQTAWGRGYTMSDDRSAKATKSHDRHRAAV